MVATDSIEGTIDQLLWFHYDIENDVLYLRKTDSRETATYADEQSDGTLLLLRQDDDQPVGITITNWWKNYGHGQLPDSLKDIEHTIEPFAKKVAA